MDTLELLARAAVVVFVMSSMVSIGLAAQVAEIIAPLRRPVWVLRALIASGRTPSPRLETLTLPTDLAVL